MEKEIDVISSFSKVEVKVDAELGNLKNTILYAKGHSLIARNNAPPAKSQLAKLFKIKRMARMQF